MHEGEDAFHEDIKFSVINCINPNLSVWIFIGWCAFKPIWQEVTLVHVLKLLKLQGQILKKKKKV